VFENRVLREYLDVRGMKQQENGESCTMRSFIFYTAIIRQIKLRRIRCEGYVARKGEECVQRYDGKARRKETTWKTEA
jgi:hypothetical protein